MCCIVCCVVNTWCCWFSMRCIRTTDGRSVRRCCGSACSQGRCSVCAVSLSHRVTVYLHTRSNNPQLCLEILHDLQAIIANIPASGFSKASKKNLEVATAAFDAVHQALLDVANETKGAGTVCVC